MTIKTISTYAVCGLVALTAATYALPRHVTVERAATLQAAPATVLALAASNEGYQTFNPYRTLDPDLRIDLYGPQSGTGSGFHFDGKDGTGSQTVAEVTQQTVTYDVDLGPLGQPTQSISASPTSDGSHVTWRVEADMGFNPVFRVMGLFMDGMMGPTFELGLENLGEAAA
ncbi:SRPBCC family protein [Ahrensia marina]|uniref:SRPBCC family protein n=1 Tax=Ahrensia marina TaxID=1514904 RepID=UPI0035CEB4CF